MGLIARKNKKKKEKKDERYKTNEKEMQAHRI